MMHLGYKTAGWAAAAALAACITGGGAQAAVITEAAPVILEGDFPGLGADSFVPLFDPALGTLTGVSATLTGQLKPGVAFNPIPPSSLSPVVFNPEIAFERVTQMLPIQSVPLTGNDLVFGTPETVDITTQPPVPLANFIGTGNNDFYITGDGGDIRRGGLGQYVDYDATTFAGQVAVTYTYTPGAAVPEPASLALLGAGLFGLCAVQARKRKSAS